MNITIRIKLKRVMVASITNIVKKSDGMMDGWNVITFVQREVTLLSLNIVKFKKGENWDHELEPFCNEKYCGAIPEFKKHY